MKFRFCGDLDAPDWLLREIATMSKIPNIRMKIICKQVISQIVEGTLDYDKVLKLTKDTFQGLSDVKAAVAAIHFIFVNAVKHDVDESTLSQELQQLGLPKENCEAFSRTLRDNREKLRERLTEVSFRMPRLDSLDWRVDMLLSSNLTDDLNVPNVQMKFNINETQPTIMRTPFSDGDETIPLAFEMSADKFRVMYAELSNARRLMEALE